MTELELVRPAPAPGIELSPTSLKVVDPALTIEDIGAALVNAAAMGDTVRWWIGDLLLYADSRWGEESAQLLDNYRLSERQATKYRWIAEKVPPSLRRENLSFSHHELVAALEPPDQTRLLALADTSDFSYLQFRETVRDHKAFEDPVPRRRATVMPSNEVDAARGIRTIRTTLERVGDGISPEGRDATGINESMTALQDVTKTVKRATSLEPLALAVAAVIAAGVRQTGLPDPAVIVPSGPWDTLVAAYATATDGGA